MSTSSLFPGYKQVEAFADDDLYESEEEVTYVTLDLGSIEPTLVPNMSHYQLIGLDTPTPFLQLGGTIFKGHHDSLLGSELLFTEAHDDAERSRRSIAHVATTGKRIRFKEVQLVPKKTDAEDQAKDVIDSPDLAMELERFDVANPSDAKGSGRSRSTKGKGRAKEKAKGSTKIKKTKGKEKARDTGEGDIDMGEVGEVPASAMVIDDG